MGRVKLKIRRLDSSSSRQVTYSKRKTGVMKKAMELSILCDIDLVLLMFAPNGKPSVCVGGRSKIEEVFSRFSQVSQQERTRRKLEGLEVLKKTFKKLDHDVNIPEFLGSGTQTIEDMINHLGFLRGHLLNAQERLSYWDDPEKITNIDLIRAMEQSLKESLGRIQEQKLLQNGMHLPTNLGCAQGTLPVSWFYNNDCQQLMFAQANNLLTQRDIGCSTDASLQNYGTYLSTGEIPDPNEQVQDSLYQFSPRLQLAGELPYPSYNENFLSERKFVTDAAENGLQESTIDYKVNQFDSCFQNWACPDEQSYTQQPD